MSAYDVREDERTPTAPAALCTAPRPNATHHVVTVILAGETFSTQYSANFNYLSPVCF